MLNYLAGQNRLNLEVAPGDLRVGIPSGVPADRAVRHNGQMRQFRKTVDETFRYTVAQVLTVWICTDVDQREDRDGVDDARVPPGQEIDSGSNQDDE